MRGARRLVFVLVAVLAFYLVLIGARGLSLLGDPRWAVKMLGVGILLLPLVGLVIVASELRFGRDTERLAALLAADPDPDAERERDPDTAFARRQAAVEAAPDDWRGWYRLAVAYGNARDTPRGRRTMRKAIAMERAYR